MADGRGIRRIVELILDRTSARRVETETRRALDRGTDSKTPVRNINRTKTALNGLAAAARTVGLALVAAFGVRAIGRGLASLFKIGTTVEETGSKFRTVFEGGSDQIDGFLKSWGRLAGLTVTQGREIAATAGSIARGFGFSVERAGEFSKSILSLAGDLQSFHNVPIEETFAAIRSGISGETEPLKRFGIILLDADVKARALAETGKKVASSLTQQEIATARLNLIYEKAGVAVGDLERTQNSTANTARRLARDWNQLREDLAEGLLPVFAELVEVAADLTETFLPLIREKLLGAAQDLSKWVKENRGEIVRWSEILVKSVRAVAISLFELVRIAFNVGNVIGRIFDIAGQSMIGAFAYAFEKIKLDWRDVLDFFYGSLKFFDFLDVLPDFSFEDVFGDPKNGAYKEFFANAREQSENLVGDLATIANSVENVGKAWLDVGRTVASNPIEPAVVPARGGGGGGGGLLGGVRRPGESGAIGFDQARSIAQIFGTGFAGASAPGLRADTVGFDPAANFRAGLGRGGFFAFTETSAEVRQLADDLINLGQTAQDAGSEMQSAMTSAAFTITDAFATGFEAILGGMSSLPEAAAGIGLGIVSGLIGGMAQYHEAQGVGKLAEGTWPPNPAAIKAALGHFAAAGLFRALGALAAKGQQNLSGGATGGATSVGAVAGRAQTLADQGGGETTIVFVDPFNPDNPLHRRQVYRGFALAKEEYGDQIPISIQRGGPR